MVPVIATSCTDPAPEPELTWEPDPLVVATCERAMACGVMTTIGIPDAVVCARVIEEHANTTEWKQWMTGCLEPDSCTEFRQCVTGNSCDDVAVSGWTTACVDVSAAFAYDGTQLALHTNQPPVLATSDATGVRVYAAGDTNWTAIPPVAASELLAMTTDSSGTAHVLYTDSATGGLHYSSRTTEWTPAERIAQSGAMASMVVGVDDTIHVLFSNARVHYGVRAPSGWTIETVSDVDAVSTHVAVDGDGGVHVAIVELTSFIDAVFHYAKRSEDGSWPLSRTTLELAALRLPTVRLAIASSGAPQAFVSGLYGQRISGAWVFDDTGFNDDLSLETPTLAIDNSGVAHLAFRSDFTTTYAARSPGGPWQRMAVFENAVSPTLAVDASGQPHLAFVERKGALIDLIRYLRPQ